MDNIGSDKDCYCCGAKVPLPQGWSGQSLCPTCSEAMDDELDGKRCDRCGAEATAKVTGKAWPTRHGMIMWLCDPCAVSFMAWVEGGCITNYDANRYRLRSEN